jgi:hypothetical protein
MSFLEVGIDKRLLIAFWENRDAVGALVEGAVWYVWVSSGRRDCVCRTAGRMEGLGGGRLIFFLLLLF